MGLTIPVVSAIGSVLFEISGRTTTVSIINLWKMIFGIIVLTVVMYFMYGITIPTLAFTPLVVTFISSVVGFARCDYYLVSAFVMIGSRTTNLILSLMPIFTGLVGHFIINDPLAAQQWIGIVIAIIGVVIVIRYGGDETRVRDFAIYKKGVLYAFIAMISLGLSLITLKIALRYASAGDIILVRSWIALLLFLATVVIMRESHRIVDVLKSKALFQTTLWGAIMFIGISVPISIIAMQYLPAAVVAAFIAITPLMIIPLAFFILKERIKKTDILGSAVCFAGIILLIV